MTVLTIIECICIFWLTALLLKKALVWTGAAIVVLINWDKAKNDKWSDRDKDKSATKVFIWATNICDMIVAFEFVYILIMKGII